jgi:mono/diheme cytochrome c family protein
MALYAQHCASCHGLDRLGGMGPALLPESLERLPREEAAKVIAQGRFATQMPAFSDKLIQAQIQALVDYIYTPPAQPPRWGLEEMRASHTVQRAPRVMPNKPVFQQTPSTCSSWWRPGTTTSPS